jgi:site-specific DNA-methyltransferase (adenine-specific)
MKDQKEGGSEKMEEVKEGFSPVIQCGGSNLTLIHGDVHDVISSEKTGIESMLSQPISLVYVDPPYGYTACAWDKRVDEARVFRHFFLRLKDKGAIVCHAAGKYHHEIAHMMRAHHWEDIYWNKFFAGNAVQAKRQHLKVVEPIMVLTKNGKAPNFYRQMTPRAAPIQQGGKKTSQAIPCRGKEQQSEEKRIYTEKSPTNLINFSVRQGRGKHPTQKPLELAEYIIKSFSQPGDLVVDFTMGSGTTAIACLRLQRNFIGIEKDLGYFKTAIERVLHERSQMEITYDKIYSVHAYSEEGVFS